MKQVFRITLIVIAIILLAAPVSVMITLFLFPFWSWIEATFGIESIGHSGPDEWCYVAVYLVLAVSIVSASALRWWRAKNSSQQME